MRGLGERAEQLPELIAETRRVHRALITLMLGDDGARIHMTAVRVARRGEQPPAELAATGFDGCPSCVATLQNAYAAVGLVRALARLSGLDPAEMWAAILADNVRKAGL